MKSFLAVVAAAAVALLGCGVASGGRISYYSTLNKRGTSGLRTCKDAQVLNLEHSWHYSWGNAPWGDKCDPPRTREFVPMIW